MAGTARYLVGLGSNMRVPRIGAPRAVLHAALTALDAEGVTVEACSPIVDSAPVGPSLRRYANAVAQVAAPHDPPGMLAVLQRVETRFGRVRRGQRWRARPLDLDILAWEGGVWVSPGLVVPHPLMRERPFVIGPAAAIAPRWRDPLSGSTLRQIAARGS